MCLAKWRITVLMHVTALYLTPVFLSSARRQSCVGTPTNLRDNADLLMDRKKTHSEEYGTTLIMSVDDEPTNHLVIEEILESAGYKVGMLS